MSYAPTRPTNHSCRTGAPGPRLPAPPLALAVPDQKWSMHLAVPARACEDEEPFGIRFSQRCDYTLVHVSGALDMATVKETRAVLHTLLAANGPFLVVDLGDLSFFDACGLSALISAAHRAREYGGWVRLARVGDYQLFMLDMLTLTDLLPAYESVSAAAGADGALISGVVRAS